ncbi:hypothetical protein C8R43DRAFT_984344 [Mycena crocata]|nr:hypothetical protein C8R43DRAFT_984344 [Mycena crocata]
MTSPKPLQRFPSFVKRPREELQEIARDTLAAVERGSYTTDFGEETHKFENLSKVTDSTTYFDADAFAQWAADTPRRCSTPTSVVLCYNSTLEGVRFCLRTPLVGSSAGSPPHRPAVLNFASATSPGGGFLFGSRAQEETIARSSNLYSALASPAAAPFYAQHSTEREPRYSHAMVYVRGVQLVRDDAGTWISPAVVDVLTSAAVNARSVKVNLQRAGKLPRGEEQRLPRDVELGVQAVMRERMARVLWLLQREGVEDIVLGSFGTGAFGNEVEPIARIWAELLGTHFKNVFRRVVFAIIDRQTYGMFRDVFKKLKMEFKEDGGK